MVKTAVPHAGSGASAPKRALKRSTKRNLFVLAVLAPTMVWFVIFMFLPIVNVVIYSFTNAHMAYDTFKFVGLQQYIKMFTADPIFPIAMRNTIVVALIIVPATVVLSILLAVGLNAMTKKLREFFTFVYFLPSIVSTVAISLVWRWLYHQNYGLINAFLELIGLPKQPFLNSSSVHHPDMVHLWLLRGGAAGSHPQYRRLSV